MCVVLDSLAQMFSCLDDFQSVLLQREDSTMRGRSITAFLLPLAALLVLVHHVRMAWSDCPGTTVRGNSPCLTTVLTCNVYDMNGKVVNCGAQGQSTFPGNFQCDQPAAGSTCTGTGQFAPCQTTCGCTKSLDAQGNVVCGTTVPCQSSNTETKQGVGC
jgi:hypothetical protein